MIKKLFIILIIFSLTPIHNFSHFINKVSASPLIDESQITRGVTLISEEKLENSTRYTYKIEGLKINDRPKQFGAYSMQDLYQNAASNL